MHKDLDLQRSVLTAFVTRPSYGDNRSNPLYHVDPRQIIHDDNMATSTQITLNVMKDWDDWIEVIHTAALGVDIWDLINPSKSKTSIQ